MNRLFFKAKPLSLSQSLIERLLKKINEIVEIKSLFGEISKIMPEIAKQKEILQENNSNEDILKMLDSNLDKVSGEIIAKLRIFEKT